MGGVDGFSPSTPDGRTLYEGPIHSYIYAGPTHSRRMEGV